MSKFNSNKKKSPAAAAKAVPLPVRKIVNPTPTTYNKAGGQAFNLTPHYELLFLMLTSFLEPEFYRTQNQTIQQVRNLLVKTQDPLFAAKAAIYARTQYGMRSISHLVAADIARGVKGADWTKRFFDKVVYRVDDAAEILAAYITFYKKPIPNSLKKGLALSLGKFNAFQLAKYKGANKGVKLVDLFNLVHPKPNAEQAKAYKDLIEGNLASTDTWESELSEAGQLEGDKAANKAEAWGKLINERKIGYFALLRNLRNILQQTDSKTIAAACKLLVDPALIKKSLVLPFRYLTAQVEIEKLNSSSDQRLVLAAIATAVDIALQNVPTFEGQTLVVLDDSGSMTTGGDPTKTPAAIGSLFASVLARTNNADLLLFDTTARYQNYSMVDPVMTIANKLRASMHGGGTSFNCIFPALNKKYDRIILLSDMQGWVGGHTPQAAFGAYCAKYKATPKVYSFDLKGYGTLQFPQSGVYALAGFSEKTLDILKVLDTDPGALLNTVNSIEI